VGVIESEDERFLVRASMGGQSCGYTNKTEESPLGSYTATSPMDRWGCGHIMWSQEITSTPKTFQNYWLHSKCQQPHQDIESKLYSKPYLLGDKMAPL